jgi:hypothetical protein
MIPRLLDHDLGGRHILRMEASVLKQTGTGLTRLIAGSQRITNAATPDFSEAELMRPITLDCGSSHAKRRSTVKSAAEVDTLRRAIIAVDGRLSQLCNVESYSTDPRCLLRIAPMACPMGVCLSDGSRLAVGDLVLDLHLWNEHIPPAPPRGPDLAWARLIAKCMEYSFGLLAEALVAEPTLRDAAAIRAKTNFVGWGDHSESMSRLIRRFGFEDVDEGAKPLPTRVHDAFENLLICALTWTHNPGALRRDKLIRQRRPVWISRAALLDRYGPSGQG